MPLTRMTDFDIDRPMWKAIFIHSYLHTFGMVFKPATSLGSAVTFLPLCFSHSVPPFPFWNRNIFAVRAWKSLARKLAQNPSRRTRTLAPLAILGNERCEAAAARMRRPSLITLKPNGIEGERGEHVFMTSLEYEEKRRAVRSSPSEPPSNSFTLNLR